MCYIFKSMKTNRLLNAGDTIALGTPIFTPYLEMPHLEDYDLAVYRKVLPENARKSFLDPYLSKDANEVRITLRAFFFCTSTILAGGLVGCSSTAQPGQDVTGGNVATARIRSSLSNSTFMRPRR